MILQQKSHGQHFFSETVSANSHWRLALLQPYASELVLTTTQSPALIYTHIHGY